MKFITVLLLVPLILSCTPKKKRKKNEFWGECTVNTHCGNGKICRDNKCVEMKIITIDASVKSPQGMVFIPGGDFIMGANIGHPMEKPQITQKTDGFFIDIHEVTWDSYLKCMETGHCSAPGCKGAGKFPVSCISWHQAQLYCHAIGKRLPTEEEWEKAARSTDARKYPWGDSPPDCNKAAFNNCKLNGPAPVDSFSGGKSPYGTYGQAGNVWEWTSTTLWPWDQKNDPDMLTAGYKPSKRVDKSKVSHFRVIRGGSWQEGPEGIRTTIKQILKTDFSSPLIGFRCAQNVKSTF